MSLLRALGFAAPLALWASFSWADIPYEGEVGLGLNWVNENNQQFGQYSAQEDNGSQLFLNLELQKWGIPEEHRSYLRLYGSHVGMDNTYLQFEQGQVNDYQLRGEWQQSIQNKGNTGLTPYTQVDQQWLLPVTWQSGVFTSDFDLDNQELHRVDQHIQRRDLKFEIKKYINAWTFKSRFDFSKKSGNDTLGAAIYSNRANGKAVILPKEIQETTRNFNLSLSYFRPYFSSEWQLSHSVFRNQIEQYLWQNPYSGFSEAVDYPLGFGAIAPAPNNSQQRLLYKGSYYKNPRWRLQWDFSTASSQQDEAFLPYTVNPQLLLLQDLPRENLGGEVESQKPSLNWKSKP